MISIFADVLERSVTGNYRAVSRLATVISLFITLIKAVFFVALRLLARLRFFSVAAHKFSWTLTRSGTTQVLAIDISKTF